MKKFTITVALLMTTLIFATGCAGADKYNMKTENGIYGEAFGENAFIKIENNLYYDSTTRIVYMKHESFYGDSYCAYYAPNGLPFRYNPETNTFEEITTN